MIECLRKVLITNFLWLVLAVSWLPSPVLAQDSCEANGIVFGFFNGVKTTEGQANYAVAWLRLLYPPATSKGDPITYELFYNDTGELADFVEVFDQRLQEHNGFLAGRFELFFSFFANEWLHSHHKEVVAELL